MVENALAKMANPTHAILETRITCRSVALGLTYVWYTSDEMIDDTAISCALVVEVTAIKIKITTATAPPLPATASAV